MLLRPKPRASLGARRTRPLEECAEGLFSEVRIAPVQHLWASRLGSASLRYYPDSLIILSRSAPAAWWSWTVWTGAMPNFALTEF
jgi:hypothetical protein